MNLEIDSTIELNICFSNYTPSRPGAGGAGSAKIRIPGAAKMLRLRNIASELLLYILFPVPVPMVFILGSLKPMKRIYISVGRNCDAYLSVVNGHMFFYFRECEAYKEELKACKSIKGRFHQFYVQGKVQYTLFLLSHNNFNLF